MPTPVRDQRKLYQVHTALADDTHEGRIWLLPRHDPALARKISNQRKLVKVRAHGKSVYAEALFADTRYMEAWLSKPTFQDAAHCNLIFLSGWYRHLLGDVPLQSGEAAVEMDISVIHAWNLWAMHHMYPHQHPQLLTHSTYMLGIVAFGLGLIGTSSGCFSIHSLLQAHHGPLFLVPAAIIQAMAVPALALGVLCLGIGFIVACLGMVGMTRR